MREAEAPCSSSPSGAGRPCPPTSPWERRASSIDLAEARLRRAEAGQSRNLRRGPLRSADHITQMDSLIVEDLGKRYFVPSKKAAAAPRKTLNLGFARMPL